MAKDYKIFISHSWTYSDDLETLRKMLNLRGYFNVEFMEVSKKVPINSENASYVKAVLKQRILSSNIILAFARIYTSHSEWMIWELETAKKNNIPIVGIVPRGQERISSEVDSRSIVDVKFITEDIVEAIRKYAK